MQVTISDGEPYYMAPPPEEETRVQRSNRHRKMLNRMWLDERTDHGVKNGRARLKDACEYILDHCSVDLERPCTPSVLFNDDAWDCWMCYIHVDKKGRCRMSIRWNFTGAAYDKRNKAHFRPWHIVWIVLSSDHKIPRNKSYSHLCHNDCCVNPRHGAWETIGDNIQRNFCQTASHLIVTWPDGDVRVWTLCPHTPPCLRPVRLPSDACATLPLY
jgi:hypothetical protein